MRRDFAAAYGVEVVGLQASVARALASGGSEANVQSTVATTRDDASKCETKRPYPV